MEVRASHASLPSVSHEQAYYVLLNPAATSNLASARLPLNLCLLIDRSTSMRGERLHQVKVAINGIINKLQAQDALSLVTFSDRAQVVLSGQRGVDSSLIRSLVSAIQPGGGTEIYPGLEASLQEIERNRTAASINHLILLTDGHTYGDEEECLEKACRAGEQQIRFSTIGLGHEWNEDFLDQLAMLSGGTSIYIDQPHQLETIFSEMLQNLETVIAREVTMQVELHPQVVLHEGYQIVPEICRLKFQANKAPIGLLSVNQEKYILLEFRVRRLPPGQQQLMRITVQADIPNHSRVRSWAWADLAIQATRTAEPETRVPIEIKGALKKLTVFKMQEQVSDDVQTGRLDRAKHRLHLMATQLTALGEKGLAQAALGEANQLAQTGTLSAEGSKKIRYGTRRLSI